MKIQYVRKSHPRRARTKDGDAQIACLRHRVSHYRVVRDARLGTSLISIHWRHAKSECVTDYKTHPRWALRVHISDSILGWAPFGTNMRYSQGHLSPITKNSEMRFILARRRLNCRLGSLWH
jgi:hypothetical protein